VDRPAPTDNTSRLTQRRHRYLFTIGYDSGPQVAAALTGIRRGLAGLAGGYTEEALRGGWIEGAEDDCTDLSKLTEQQVRRFAVSVYRHGGPDADALRAAVAPHAAAMGARFVHCERWETEALHFDCQPPAAPDSR
jgi:hypothetical protein